MAAVATVAAAEPAPGPRDAPLMLAGVASLEGTTVRDTGVFDTTWDQLGPRFALELGRWRTQDHWIGHLGVSEFRTYPTDPAYMRYLIVDGLAIYEHRWDRLAVGGGGGLALVDVMHHDVCGQSSYSRSDTFFALHAQVSHDIARLGAGMLAARIDGDLLPFNVAAVLLIPDAAANFYVASISIGIAYQLE